MKIFLVRHGKDDDRYRGGWSDRPLISEGKEQVKKLANFLSLKEPEYNIKKIISSDLKRAMQTTNIINEKLNVRTEFTEKLREMNNGELAGMPNEEALKKYPGLYYSTLKIDEKYPGGESPIEFYNRIIKDFEDIVKENKDENIMIVTHAGVINIIYRYVNNMEWSNKIKSIKVSNASIYSLNVEENKRYFELENYNEYLSCNNKIKL